MIGVMKEYVDLFYTMKSNAKAAGNEGKESIAKIHLNGGYGKWGQRLSYLYPKQYILHDNEESVKIFHNAAKKAEIKDFKIINSGTVLCAVQQNKPPPETIAVAQAVQIAVFVTDQARLKLYKEFIQPLGKRLLYCDTDSALFTQRKGEWSIEDSKLLGAAKSETAGKKIAQFWSCGKKYYGYMDETGKREVKLKGFNLKKVGDDLGYAQGLEVALDNSKTVSVSFDQIRRHEKFGLDTRTLHKPCQAKHRVKREGHSEDQNSLMSTTELQE